MADSRVKPYPHAPQTILYPCLHPRCWDGSVGRDADGVAQDLRLQAWALGWGWGLAFMAASLGFRVQSLVYSFSLGILVKVNS